MSRRKPNAVRVGHGTMCKFCGKNCGRGGSLKKHVETVHTVAYDDYKKCFYGEEVRTLLADSWDDSVSTSEKRTVVTHVLVRRFITDPGPRGVPRAARPSLSR
jgi:hypothetical protein